MNLNKRAQEEIVGFVLIVVLVAVIFLIFLAISLGSKPVERTSPELGNFLDAAIKYTSNCEIYEGNFYDVKALIRASFENPQERCINGKTVLETLNTSFAGMIEASYPVDEDSPTKGIELEIYYQEEEQKRQVLKINYGSCKSGVIGTIEAIPSGSGNIYIRLKKC